MFLPSYKAETQSGLSPSIWGNLPLEEWRIGRNGLFFMDDFVNAGKASASGATTNGGYGAYTTASSTTIQPSAPTNTGDNYGVLLYSPNNAANAEAYLGTGLGIGYCCQMPSATDVGNTFAFECRIAKSGIGADCGFFFGLGDTALSITTGSLANTTGDLISTGNFLGFSCLMNGGFNVDCVYQAASQAKQTVKATAKALTAATFVRLGFKFDSQGPVTKRIIYYVDGVEVGTYITDTNITAATFPSATYLAMLGLVKQKTTTACTVSLDWWAFGQSRVSGISA